VIKLRRTLIERAAGEAETVMPGYTHLLHAQPTTLSHYLLAIQDHLARDTRRLLAAYDTTDQCTLGCGAMSGTSLPVDRERVRELLGFATLCENTIDSVSASDHVAEANAALASVMMIIGRLCQDLYIWSSQEFAMIDIPDSFASPSSLMPQKKNALVLEYVRSRTARSIGHLAAGSAVMHNVGYMDTEEVEIETCRPLFDAFELAEQSVPTIEALVAQMQANRELMRQRAAWGFSSVTALAEAVQTRANMSYRTAHRIVARAVLLAVESQRDATGIDADLLDRAAVEMIGKPLGLDATVVAEALDPRKFVDHHAVTGGPAPAEVTRMIWERRQPLEADDKSCRDRSETIARADRSLRDAAKTIAAK
jgi:argininosuccinate lyase